MFGKITVEKLNGIGFRTVGETTRLRISHALELCWMHNEEKMRLQTIRSGFTERLAFRQMEEVKAFILLFSQVIDQPLKL